jgi:hypothetical protein
MMDDKIKRESTGVPAEEECSLSPQRVFVVQFYLRGEAEQEFFRGRVEHMVSGHATWFSSVAELATFFTQVLQGAQEQP